MSYNFLPYSQDQIMLLPPSLKDWVPDDSLVVFLSDAVDRLEERGKLKPFFAAYRSDGWGRAPYHPVMMVKVLLYGYAVGVRSSREIQRALQYDVGFRFLAANQVPNFRTISDFRKDHLKLLGALFVDVLELCAEAGLAKLGRVALDGRKVRGNAALDRNRRRKELKKEVERILKEADQTDRTEDSRHGENRGDDDLPPQVRGRDKRLDQLQAALERLSDEEEKEKRAQQEKIDAQARKEEATGKKKSGRRFKPVAEMTADPEAKTNLTDPESRVLSTRNGWVQGYNGQAMVDCESQVIVAQALTQDVNDACQLEPMLKRCEEQAGRLPDELLADAGYWSDRNAALEEKGQTTFLIATTKWWKQRDAWEAEGEPDGELPEGATRRERMEHRLKTAAGRASYKQRSPMVEGVFGQMHGRRLNNFLLRGYEKASGEWALFCTTHNLLKLWRSGWSPATA